MPRYIPHPDVGITSVRPIGWLRRWPLLRRRFWHQIGSQIRLKHAYSIATGMLGCAFRALSRYRREVGPRDLILGENPSGVLFAGSDDPREIIGDRLGILDRIVANLDWVV